MARHDLTHQQLTEAMTALEAADGNQSRAAREAGLDRATFRHRLTQARVKGITAETKSEPEAPSIVNIKEALRKSLLRGSLSYQQLEAAMKCGAGVIFDAMDDLKADGVNVVREGDRWTIAKNVAPSWTDGNAIEIVSRPDNTFLVGACGDQHVGSKHHREDVNHDLYSRYAKAGVQAVLNTGNWIDGEASFNRHELVAHGLDAQIRLMAEVYPKYDFPTYAVWGDDHEGWYAKREGIDVGRYAEGIMRSEGHNWTNVGFMEAHIKLVNANTGKSAIMAVVHPGGGSSYAISYRPQKIIESFEGGEKPAVLLLGHYHKLDSGNVRNVWFAQTGTTEDQSTFMRKKSLEAHVGGLLIGMEQDPDTGSIIGFTPTMQRYFNRGYYVNKGLANNRWSNHGPVTPIPRGIRP